MRKAIIFIIGIILIASLWASFYKNEEYTDDRPQRATDTEAPVRTTGINSTRVPERLVPLKLPINLDYHWGIVDCDSYDGKEPIQSMPKIKGLYSKSTMWFCHKDTCQAERVVIAVRCPDNDNLQKWFSKTFYKEVSNLDIAYKTAVPKPYRGLSAKSQCNYYIDFFHRDFMSEKCHHDRSNPIEQNGLLISDIWNDSRYYTFAVASWYDMASCGYTTRSNFLTVDSNTGRQLELGDMVELGDSTAFAILLLRHLKTLIKCILLVTSCNLTVRNGISLLELFDGCALTEDGLLITYFPYNISVWADGHFYAQIPYQTIKKAGIKLKVKL